MGQPQIAQLAPFDVIIFLGRLVANSPEIVWLLLKLFELPGGELKNSS
jgi:hypothetical protein